MSLINRLFRREQLPIAEALEMGELKFRKKDLIFCYDKQTDKVLKTPLPKDERRWQEFGRHIGGYSVAKQEGHDVEYVDYGDRMLVQATGEVKFSHSDGLERDINIYNYASNNPIRMRDAFGLWINDETCGRIPAIVKNSKIYQDLAKNNFIKDKIDTEKVVAKYRTRKNYLFAGPSLHIMVVTLRCNHRCLYCHASARDMEDMEKDMTKETAKKRPDKRIP